MERRIGTMILSCGLALVSTAALAQSHSDKAFLAKSSQGNVTEVELSKLALTKSQNAQVRAFAERMIHDHTMLGKTLAPFLAQAGVQSSVSLNTEHQRLYNKLKGLSGSEFDKEFVSSMDQDHHEDLEDFRKEIDTTQDAQLKIAVIKGEKTIAEHTSMIDGIAKGMGISPGA